ncbi:MAG: hypothetical protein RJA10_2646, partial [Pseudomonadota bacterium]
MPALSLTAGFRRPAPRLTRAPQRHFLALAAAL